MANQTKSLASLRLIQFRAGYNLPVHVAIERGHFQRHGLHVEISYTPGSQYLIDAVREGLYEIGHAAADDAVADVESHTDSDLFLFMGLHSGLLSLMGSREHRDIESLRGKTLAVDARHSGFVFILEKMLRSRGFGAKDYRLVEVGGWEKRYYALLEGKVSATLLTEPYIGDAVEAGCHLLGRGDEIMPVYQATCGMARRAWAQKNADLLVSYTRAYIEATEWCFEPKNRKACLTLLTKHNGIVGTAAERTLDQLLDPKHGLYPMAELNLPGIAAALELRAEMGYLSHPVPSPEKYVDLSYHRKAVPSH